MPTRWEPMTVMNSQTRKGDRVQLERRIMVWKRVVTMNEAGVDDPKGGRKRLVQVLVLSRKKS